MAIITEDYCSQEVYRLLREKGDIWWRSDMDGDKSPCVTCAACGKGFDVEGWKNISKLY